jgi:tetratricopeptide (TPR) repeat protein
MKTASYLLISVFALGDVFPSFALGSGSSDQLFLEKGRLIIVVGQSNTLAAEATPVPSIPRPTSEPDNGLAVANRIKSLLGNHQMDQALAVAQQETENHADVALAWYSLGDVLMQLQRSKDAIPALQKALALNPRIGPALLDLGNCLALQGQYDPAIDALSRAIDRMPDVLPAWVALYRCFNAKHDPLGAEDKIKDLLKAHPRSACGWLALSQVQMYEQLWSSAMESLQKAVDLKPDFPEALNYLGIAYGHSQQMDKAVDCFARAVAVRPGYDEALNNLGYTYLQMGQTNKAIEVLKQALQSNPKHQRALYNLTSAYTKEQQWALAKETCQTLGQINPGQAARLSRNFPASDTGPTSVQITPPTPIQTETVPSVPPISPIPATITTVTTASVQTPTSSPLPVPSRPSSSSRDLDAAPFGNTTHQGFNVQGSSVGYNIAPPASWVKPLVPDAVPIPTSSEVEGGVDYLLVDNQQLMDPTAYFSHYTLRLTNEEGLQNGSDIRAEFDPNYQTLTLHWLKVKRNGVWQDRLSVESFQILRREKNLDSQMLDGRYSVICHLQDVRVGDLVDFAYTVKGANPVFGGKFFYSFFTAFTLPVHLFSNQLITAPSRMVFLKSFGGAREPTRTQRADQSELIAWKKEEVPAAQPEPRTSEWYDAFGWVQVSEFTAWKDVVDWGLATFSLSNAPSGKLGEKITEIAQAHARSEDRALAAIGFVQNEIRYLGSEMGANSYKPTPASIVFEHRFGDCKDKTQLCVVMLRALGIEAYPALVNSGRRAETDKLLPSPLDFDHAIVQLIVDGQPYWIDVTRSGQRGHLQDFYVDDFKKALVLKPGVDAMVPLKVSASSMPHVAVEEAFTVKSMTDPVNLLIHTVFKGRAAENIREFLGISGQEALGKAYLNYYTRGGAKIQVEKPLRFQDFPDDNRFEIWQGYTIFRLWTRDSPALPWKASFTPYSIVDAVGNTVSVQRTTPYQLNYPTDISEDINIQMFRPWNIDTAPIQVNTPNIAYSETSSLDNKTMHFKYHYQILAADLLPANVGDYNEQINKIRERLGHRLTYLPGIDLNAPGGYRLNWLGLMIFALVLGATCFGAYRIYSIRPFSGPSEIPLDLAPYEGVRGWLFLVLIGLARSIFANAKTGWLDGRIIFNLMEWNIFTVPGSPRYQSLLGPMMLIELSASIVLLVLSILAIVLMFQKRYTFPKVMIALLVGSLVYHLIDHALASQISSLAANGNKTFVQLLFQMIGGCAIWIPYFLVSKRVRATFRY